MKAGGSVFEMVLECCSQSDRPYASAIAKVVYYFRSRVVEPGRCLSLTTAANLIAMDEVKPSTRLPQRKMARSVTTTGRLVVRSICGVARYGNHGIESPCKHMPDPRTSSRAVPRQSQACFQYRVVKQAYLFHKA